MYIGYIDPMGGFAAGNYMEQYGGNNMAGGFMNNTGETESKSTDKKVFFYLLYLISLFILHAFIY